MTRVRPRFSNVAALTFTAMVLGDKKNVNGPRCGVAGRTTGTYECTLDAPAEQTPEQIDRAIVEACLKRARRALRRRSVAC